MSQDEMFLIGNPADNGVWLASEEESETLANLTGRSDRRLHLARIDLSDCSNQRELMTRMAAVLEFPDWFGCNWDALQDCLTDLSWLPADGYVLLFEEAVFFRDSDEKSFEILLEILELAAEEAAEQGVSWQAFLLFPDDLFDEEDS